MTYKITYGIITVLFIIIGVYLDISHIHVPNGIDKIAHFIAFFLATSWLMFLITKLLPPKFFPQLIVILFLFLGVFAAFAEKIQNITADRSCDSLDWMANIAGIMLAGLVFYLTSIRLKSLENDE